MIKPLTNHSAGDCGLCIQLQAKCKNIKNANQTGTENMLTMKLRKTHVQRNGMPLHFAFTYIVVGVAHAQAGIIYLELFDTLVPSVFVPFDQRSGTNDPGKIRF